MTSVLAVVSWIPREPCAGDRARMHARLRKHAFTIFVAQDGSVRASVMRPDGERVHHAWAAAENAIAYAQAWCIEQTEVAP